MVAYEEIASHALKLREEEVAKQHHGVTGKW